MDTTTQQHTIYTNSLHKYITVFATRTWSRRTYFIYARLTALFLSLSQARSQAPERKDSSSTRFSVSINTPTRLPRSEWDHIAALERRRVRCSWHIYVGGHLRATNEEMEQHKRKNHQAVTIITARKVLSFRSSASSKNMHYSDALPLVICTGLVLIVSLANATTDEIRTATTASSTARQQPARILSRRKRYLIFPEGSSFQLGKREIGMR